MTQFSVATLALETRAVLDRFIAHYRQAGASEVTIYFDGATDHLADLNDSVVTVIRCDEAFWQSHGCDHGRVLNLKLQTVFQTAAKTARHDWVLLVDADELLVSPEPFAALLDRIPPAIEAVSIPNVEAVWGPTDALGAEFAATHFRRPARRRLHKVVQRAVYDAQTRTMLRNGLAGHSAGKQVLRTGKRYDLIASHHAERDGQPINVWLGELVPGTEAVIAHFDAIGLERWREKHNLRTSGRAIPTPRAHRKRQMTVIRDTAGADDAAMAALFRRMYHLTPVQYAVLRAFGLAFRHDVFMP